MTPFFIIDTNVVIAGLLTAHADSPVARVLDGMLAVRFGYVVSEQLLAEYRSVALRPALQKLHGLRADEVDVLLLDIARHAIVLNPASQPHSPRAPDAGDQFLWDLLACRPDLTLVTGDKLLLQDAAMHSRVITAQALVAQLGH